MHSVRNARDTDADAIARVHVASWGVHYRGLLTDHEIERRSFELRRGQWVACLREPNRITLVAEDARGEVVGFASAMILDEPHAGFASYLHTLYLAPGSTGGGIGHQLLAVLGDELIARGISTMALRTLRLNRARSFYERLGARRADEFTYDAGHFDDVAYGFDDLRGLVSALHEFRDAERDGRGDAADQHRL